MILNTVKTTGSKISGTIRSSVSFGFSSVSFDPSPTQVNPQKVIKKLKVLVFNFKGVINKTKFFQVKKSIESVSSIGSIFGTTFKNAKLFLTATSNLSIDKQDVSPLVIRPLCPAQGGRIFSLGGIN